MGILSTLMTYLSRHPQPLKTPSKSLHLAQHAPLFLASSEATHDTQETWFLYEQLFLACLRTKDDDSARLCLQRLGDRFGADSGRVRALSGLYDEATAADKKALEEVLKQYDGWLKDDPTSLQIEKRRIALLQSLGRPQDAIASLCKLLDNCPIDTESWSHLATLYREQGLYAQSIFCLEEVLIIQPNAYPIHARLGETSYISAGSGNTPNLHALGESVAYYCRSLELCDWYLRGWYGLRAVTERIVNLAPDAAKAKDAGLDQQKIQMLREHATAKLAEIVRRYNGGEEGWTGFDEAEVEAARVAVEMPDVPR